FEKIFRDHVGANSIFKLEIRCDSFELIFRPAHQYKIAAVRGKTLGKLVADTAACSSNQCRLIPYFTTHASSDCFGFSFELSRCARHAQQVAESRSDRNFARHFRSGFVIAEADEAGMP